MPAAPSVPALTIRSATSADVPMLAELNRQLLEDEGYRSVIPLERLLARHRGWLESGEWRQDLLALGGETVGYVAYAPEPEALDPARPEIHLRQFCIDRSRRGGGLGRACFALFLRERVAPGARVTLDVLESNPAGQAFWQAVGCRPYFRRLEIFGGDG